MENQENKELRNEDYAVAAVAAVGSAFAVAAAGAAVGSAVGSAFAGVAFGSAFAGVAFGSAFAVVAGSAFAGAAVATGKKAGVFIGTSLLGISLVTGITSYSITKKINQEKSALVQKIQSQIQAYPVKLESGDYLTIVSPNATNHYQLTTNEQGIPEYTPLSALHSNRLEQLSQKQKTQYEIERKNLDEEYRSLTSTLKKHSD